MSSVVDSRAGVELRRGGVLHVKLDILANALRVVLERGGFGLQRLDVRADGFLGGFEVLDRHRAALQFVFEGELQSAESLRIEVRVIFGHDEAFFEFASDFVQFERFQGFAASVVLNSCVYSFRSTSYQSGRNSWG